MTRGTNCPRRSVKVLGTRRTTRSENLGSKQKHKTRLAERAPSLACCYLGREVARSDASGVAHLVIEAETDKTIELTIDTSEQPALRPKSPTARFRMPNRDDVVVLEQSFQAARKPAVRIQRVASGPVRIR